MEDEDGPVTPFWLRNSNNTLRQSNRNRRQGRSSSLFLNSTVFVILLLVVAVLFMFIIIPSILNLTSQIFKPQLVKKSWDSLNLVLVLFAIVCAFLSRTNNGGGGGGDNTNSDEDLRNVVVSSSSRNRNQWYEYADRTGINNSLKSSNSYPDLRLESSWTVGDGDGNYRFYDDTHLSNYRFTDGYYFDHRRRRNRELDVQDSGAKNIHVSTFANRSNEIFPSRSPPPSTPPLPAPDLTTVKRKAKRTNRTLAHEEKAERPVNSELELKKLQVQPLAPPPPPSSPPPPPPPPPLSEKKHGSSDRKRGGATKDLLTLIYQQKRKKKQRQKSVENFDSILPPPPSPPDPPPPPPQTSSFQNLFSSKKNKTKKIHLAAPPPPPLLSKTKTQIALAQSQTTPITKHKPPLPVKTSRFNTLDDNTSSGSDSPHTIPPPPPLPPFKMTDWKFVVQGDYVRIKSSRSSGSDSPDMDDIGPSSNNESNQSTSVMDEIDGGDSLPPQPPMFCPSPDVNTKADNFIARFRAGLKLEKMNSINEKQWIGLSKLGPEPNPGPDSDPSQI